MELPKERTDDVLAGYFREYVESFQNRERHTPSACEEELAYEKLVTYFFPNELKPQVKLYDKMMDVAVEYEESGFIAGYRMCLKHLLGQEQLFDSDTTNTPPDEEQRQPEAIAASVDALDFISSKQIAKMFGTSNWKVVRRIDERILPETTEEEKRCFIKQTEKNRYNNKIGSMYYLGMEACKKYIEYMMPSKKYHNVEVGIARLIVEMKSRFQNEAAPA